MSTRTARIKAHTRVSKHGKVHKVRAHGRSVTIREWLAAGFTSAKGKQLTWGTAGAMGLTGAAYMFSTAMSVAAALIWAILLGCMAVITMLLMTKQQRRAKRKAFRQSAALSMERRMKLWTHHRMVQFKKPVSRPKTKTPPSSNQRPMSTAAPSVTKPETKTLTCQSCGKKMQVSRGSFSNQCYGCQVAHARLQEFDGEKEFSKEEIMNMKKHTDKLMKDGKLLDFILADKDPRLM